MLYIREPFEERIEALFLAHRKINELQVKAFVEVDECVRFQVVHHRNRASWLPLASSATLPTQWESEGHGGYARTRLIRGKTREAVTWEESQIAARKKEGDYAVMKEGNVQKRWDNSSWFHIYPDVQQWMYQLMDYAKTIELRDIFSRMELSVSDMHEDDLRISMNPIALWGVGYGSEYEKYYVIPDNLTEWDVDKIEKAFQQLPEEERQLKCEWNSGTSMWYKVDMRYFQFSLKIRDFKKLPPWWKKHVYEQVLLFLRAMFPFAKMEKEYTVCDVCGKISENVVCGCDSGFVGNVDKTLPYWFPQEEVVEEETEDTYLQRYFRERTEGFVYFAKAGDTVKIGKSVDPKKRIKSLQTANPDIKLVFVEKGGRERETQLHALFKEDRLQREFFRFSENIEKYLKQNERKNKLHTLK